MNIELSRIATEQTDRADDLQYSQLSAPVRKELLVVQRVTASVVSRLMPYMGFVIPIPDWALLQKQKADTLQLIDTCSKLPSASWLSSLDGIIHFIDSIQDAAVAQGATELEVFGQLKSEE